MPQSLTRLPKERRFRIFGRPVIILDHKIVNRGGLFGEIMSITNDSYSRGGTLSQFEEHGINYESAIECCVRELEYDAVTLHDILF